MRPITCSELRPLPQFGSMSPFTTCGPANYEMYNAHAWCACLVQKAKRLPLATLLCKSGCFGSDGETLHAITGGAVEKKDCA